MLIEKMPIYKKVNKKFFKKWTSEMAYVLGFISADGYITINKRGGHFLGIQITDKSLLVKIRNVMGSDHKISKRVMRENERPLYRLQIGSIEICEDLDKLGIKQNKTNNMVIPSLPEQYSSDFVRGYFDGDGNVWVGKINKGRAKPILVIMTVFTSCSGVFLKQLQTCLLSLGLRKGCIYKSKQGYYRLQYSVSDSLKIYDFMYNSTHLRNKLFLARKKKVFLKFIERHRKNAVVV